MKRVVVACLATIALAAAEPAIGGFAWGVVRPFPRWIHQWVAGGVLLAYCGLLLSVVWGARRQARRAFLALSIPVLAFGLLVAAWSLYYVASGWVPYSLLLLWAICLILAQGLGLSAALGNVR